ncbi:MAG: cobalamin biosynthesis protein CobD [Variovorax paradoxus]|uniref:Cobalamin biosynthesis protein CobD n=1 Tax=Variovorax paradoxus TaxID=34073 RepID=A0A2W5Q014_VARPD|nr:MAG: cobalamin biosynthesis protein CobD [Variovorax paradoxus]
MPATSEVLVGAHACVAIGALWLALAIDRWLGEPPARWHPVVWMGAWLGWAGPRIAPVAAAPQPGAFKPLVLGALAWWAGAAMVFVAAWAVQWHVIRHLPWPVAALTLALALKPLMAWRMLRDEVLAVDAALAESLEAGRMRLAHLVSRDTQSLDADAVRESAIESLAENLNDSVVAPLFWFVLVGLPGAAVYRFANTADAMWGYPGERGGRCWAWAGKWAARVDDGLSWLPARLSALLIALAARRWPPGLAREAARTPSPNSGWPMAAMALMLGVRLRKPGVYTLHADGRAPSSADVQRCARLGGRVMMATAATASLALAAAGGLGFMPVG